MPNKKAGQVIEKAKANGDSPPAEPAKHDILPPAADSGTVKGPKKFETIGDVIREQQRLYKLVFKGELALSDLTKLIYALGQMIQGIKAKSEIDALEDAYIKQWQGVRIIAPEDHEPIPDPHDVAIEGEVLSDG